jgi:hypothetical protein
VIAVLHQLDNFSAIWQEQVNFQWNDEVHFVLDQQVDRHVASLGYIILIQSQPIFALS